MTTSAITAPATPIYEFLVRERGDALAESRKAAEHTHARARQALDWSGLRSAEVEREERAFSPFGHRAKEDGA